MSHNSILNSPPRLQPLTYSMNDLAAVLSVSRREVRRRIASGEWPAVRLGRRVLVRHDDVQAWLERGGNPLPAEAVTW